MPPKIDPKGRAAARENRRSTYVKTKKRVTRSRSDKRASAFTAKQSEKVVVRIHQSGGGSPSFKHEGDRYKGDEALLGIKGTVKLVAGVKYVFSLQLPKSCQIVGDVPPAGAGAAEATSEGNGPAATDRRIQVRKSGSEEAESFQVKEDEKGNQCFEWTNTFVPCKNKERQVVKLSFMVDKTESKMELPILVKTYKEGDSGARSGNPLNFLTYTMEPNLMLAYDLKGLTFS